jgi:hypothetical protein
MGNHQVVAEVQDVMRVCLGKSVEAWALDKGMKPDTARRVLRRWAGRMDRRPHGGISRQVIGQLEGDLGLRLCGPSA